jgi:hypothetical protein
MEKGAIFSTCEQYRYRLWRHWGLGAPRARAVFIMLNPSTADAEEDDPTIRKCIGFAERMGYAGIDVVNLYAYRATKPAELKRVGWPKGPDNDRHILEACRNNIDREAICAWGTNARGNSRPMDVLDLIRAAGITPMALKVTNGVPHHPLMLPYTCSKAPL